MEGYMMYHTFVNSAILFKSFYIQSVLKKTGRSFQSFPPKFKKNNHFYESVCA